MADIGHRPPVPEQQAAIDDRGRDLFLHAAAGSGKTTVLVERFCDTVCEEGGADAETGIENVLAFTFTDKAAGEMKRRIRLELRRRAGEVEPADPGRAARLRALAREAESAWVSTIHAFCRRILGAHSLAAGLDPRFAVLDEAAAGRLAREAFDTAFECFAGGDDPDRIELAAAFRYDGLRELVITAHDELRSRGQAAPELPELPPSDVEGAIAELREAAEEALAATVDAAGRKDPDRYRECIAVALSLTDGRVPTEAELSDCFFESGAAAFGVPEVARFHAARRRLESRLAELAEGHQYVDLAELLRLYAAEYAERKEARSALDFEDLQLLTRDLLEQRSDLRRRLQARFHHVMVDEFQDTNRLQLSVIELLHSERGVEQNRLFTVGDEFQSIYSFRHADVDVFRAQRRRAAEAPEDVAGVRALLGNFRSRPEAIALVNALGRALLPGFEELRVGAVPAAPPRGDGPAVELLVTESLGWDEEGALPGVSPDEQAQPWRLAEARFLAARLAELWRSGFPRGDMVVLLRSFTHVEAYEDALAQEGLEPYVVGGRGYWSRQQVTDLRQLLGVLANPLDELALLGALASPCCGVLPDTLWLLRRAAGPRNLWPAVLALYGGDRRQPGEDEEWRTEAERWAADVPAADAERLRRFCSVVGALREDASRAGLEALIDRAIRETGYDLALLMRPGGRRRMANVRKLMRLAGEYEAAEGHDLRGFLDFVESESEIRAREGEAALHAEQHDGVRVMTIHGAKGLEFPLVAVADLGRGLGGGFPPALRLHPGGAETGHEADAVRVGLRLARLGRRGRHLFGYEELKRLAEELTREEERRILHVAVTRAEERLILSGAVRRDKLGRDLGLTAPLLDQVLPALGWDGEAARLRLPAPLPREGLDAGFPPAEVAVRVNEPAGESQQELRVVPGPEPEDDSALRAPIPHPALEPPAAAAAPTAVRHISYSALALYERCGYRFYAERVLGMRPELPGAAGRPGGGDGESRYGRGNVVHELLERGARTGWPEPDPALAAALLEREGIDAGEGAVAAVLDLVSGFVESPLRARLAAARLSPEAPFAFRLGRLVVRGEIDLLAELGDEVVVVDYKSDRLAGADPSERVGRYDVQRRIYALAALRAWGKPVTVAYVFLERPGEPVEERFEPGDVPALTAGLEAVSARIERGEFEVTADPGPELCIDCPARRRLCTHPSERTLGTLASA